MLIKRLAAQGAGEVAVDVVSHASAKDHLAALARQEDTWLCMTAHGRRPVPEMLLGSVPAGVVRRTNKPVFLCGPCFDTQAHKRVEVVVICMDGSRLAESMLSHAVKLSRLLGARLQLLQVIAPQRAAIRQAETSAYVDVAEASYVRGLARRLRETHQAKVDWEVLHGDPAESIVSYANEYPNVMLAMTTHGRSGLSQVVAGSVSHEVLHEACCPVAVLRPDEQA